MIVIHAARKPTRPYRARSLPTSSAITGLPRDLLQDPSPVPLWYRLVRLTRELIERGALRPWEQLPSEQYVADHLHISRPTVRQAWQELEKAQLIIRDHGKGTFVWGKMPVATGD